MTFRTKLALAFTPVALIPVAALAVIVRSVMNERFVAQFNDRVAAELENVERDLEAFHQDLRTRIEAIGAAAADDNRFRLAAASEQDRSYLLDYAERAMRLGGLDVLHIQEDDGRVLSSGHFRNEFDRRLPLFGSEFSRTEADRAVASVRTPDGRLLAIVRADSVRLGNRWLYLMGGVAADRFLGLSPTTDDVKISLHVGDVNSRLGGAEAVTEDISLPFISGDRLEPNGATISVAHSLEPLHAIQRQVDRWFVIIFGLTGMVALGVALVIAAQLSRPISVLAERTKQLDLDNLDVQFDTTRRDEIGALTRLLGAMVARIRAGTARLREVERRAAVGDLARQINHDIKNGLVPIRNVFDHLSQVQHEAPADLARVFGERRETVQSSIGYLENLASQYAKLSPGKATSVCDVASIIHEAVRGVEVPDGCDVRVEIAEDLPMVRGDRLAIRRIVENLIGNAIDSLDTHGGVVVVTCDSLRAPPRMIRVTVQDSGRGMKEDELERAFEDFYTTKPSGTGLGLSVVRRLIGDLGGAIRVNTEPAVGTTVIVDLPHDTGEQV